MESNHTRRLGQWMGQTHTGFVHLFASDFNGVSKRCRMALICKPQTAFYGFELLQLLNSTATRFILAAVSIL